MALAIKNAAQLVCVCRQKERVLKGREMRDIAVMSDGAVLIQDGRVAWVGPTKDLPRYDNDAQVIDASAKTVLPGLIDSHTHLVFAGRANRNLRAVWEAQPIKKSPLQEVAFNPRCEACARHPRID